MSSSGRWRKLWVQVLSTGSNNFPRQILMDKLIFLKKRKVLLEVLLNSLTIWQFGKRLYVMVRRLPNRFIGKCSGYFRCLYLVYWFVTEFVNQNGKDLVHKIFYNIYLLCTSQTEHHAKQNICSVWWFIWPCQMEHLAIAKTIYLLSI